MNDFNKFERKVSELIKRYLFFHQFIKYIYQYCLYFLNKEKNNLKINKLSKLINLSKESLFYGYYDHTPFSENMKLFVSHSHNDNLKLKLFRFDENILKDAVTIIESKYYNYQTGLRPIWINSKNIIFNYVKNNTLISGLYNVENKSIKDLKYPVQEVSFLKNILFSIDYKKLENINRDYGYNLSKKNKQEFVNGIVAYDYKKQKILFNLKLEKIIKNSKNKNLVSNNDYEINHIHHCPYSESIVFIFRNRKIGANDELFFYNYKTDIIKLIYSGKLISHYCWIEKDKIFAYMQYNNINGFYEISFKNKISITQEILPNISFNNNDGHPSLSPNKKWIVYDTYPNKARKSSLYLIKNQMNRKKILIGTFYSPMKYYGYKRCDLHPRWSPDGKFISFDSVHEGTRKTYLMDISKLIKKYE